MWNDYDKFLVVLFDIALFCGPQANGCSSIPWLVMYAPLFGNVLSIISHFQHGHLNLMAWHQRPIIHRANLKARVDVWNGCLIKGDQRNVDFVSTSYTCSYFQSWFLLSITYYHKTNHQESSVLFGTAVSRHKGSFHKLLKLLIIRRSANFFKCEALNNSNIAWQLVHLKYQTLRNIASSSSSETCCPIIVDYIFELL